MSRQYRSKVRIYVDIMKAIKKDGEAKPTRILYSANLSHSRLIKYLDFLLKEGFIREIKIKNSKRYALTEKGERFLREFRVFEKFASAFGISI